MNKEIKNAIIEKATVSKNPDDNNPKNKNVEEGDEVIRTGSKSEKEELINLYEVKMSENFNPNLIYFNKELMQKIDLFLKTDKYKDKINAWGIKKSLLYDNNSIKAIFYGPSGTGKTLSVHLIAHKLNKKIFKCNVSQVYNKWMGESEKSVKKIFENYDKELEKNKDNPPILFLDEADSLLGRRVEIHQKSDITMNMVINIFLQEMEISKGIIICCTNLMETKVIDEAFLRRLNIKIKFDYPDLENRIKIFKSHLGKAPLDKDVNLEMILKDYEMSGGSLAIAVERAGYYAIVENRNSIAKDNIIRALESENQLLQKYIPKKIRGFIED
jgi:ATP-dependent 26S proteasome regulatory subunit